MIKVGVLVRNELNLNLGEMFPEIVAKGGEIVNVPLGHTKDDREVAEKAKGFDYVVAGRENWSAMALQAVSDRLKFIARFGTGYDTLDLKEAERLGIAIANSPGKNARSVAEHALALTLSLLRKVTEYDREVRRGTAKARLSQSLEGTFGFLGFGNIPRHLARMLAPFDVDMIAYDLYPNEEAAKKLGVRMTSLEEVIERSNILSCHLPLTPDTKHILCRKTFEKMKDGAYLINTSRGDCQVDADLIWALKNKKLAGAALDVLESDCEDPMTCTSELKELPNVILTPHAGAVSTQGVRDVFEFCAQMVMDFDAGRAVPTILNPEYAQNRK